jgi:hypothetical protein
MESLPMSKLPVSPGDIFHKAGKPGTIWVVERLYTSQLIPHAVLTKFDDPTTKISISADTLMNRFYYNRHALPLEIAN